MDAARENSEVLLRLNCNPATLTTAMVTRAMKRMNKVVFMEGKMLEREDGVEFLIRGITP